MRMAMAMGVGMDDCSCRFGSFSAFDDHVTMGMAMAYAERVEGNENASNEHEGCSEEKFRVTD